MSQRQDAEQLIELLDGNKLNWLVVDHYGLDVEWENRMAPYVDSIMVIDDLANRFHACRLLLDQNYTSQERYHNLAPCCCKLILGPSATVIEKHFTLSRADGGEDSAFSIEPAEMAQLVGETEHAWQALGHVPYGPTDAELNSLQYQCSLYVVQNLKAGDELTRANVRAIRPELGLPPKYFEVVLGRTLNQDVLRGTALRWELLS